MPGTWRLLDVRMQRFAVTCPGCGLYVALLHHTVCAEGFVDPLFICIAPMCDWIGRLQLLEWKGGKRG